MLHSVGWKGQPSEENEEISNRSVNGSIWAEISTRHTWRNSLSANFPKEHRNTGTGRGNLPALWPSPNIVPASDWPQRSASPASHTPTDRPPHAWISRATWSNWKLDWSKLRRLAGSAGLTQSGHVSADWDRWKGSFPTAARSIDSENMQNVRGLMAL